MVALRLPGCEVALAANWCSSGLSPRADLLKAIVFFGSGLEAKNLERTAAYREARQLYDLALAAFRKRRNRERYTDFLQRKERQRFRHTGPGGMH
jgi:hypothetical protein